MGFCCGGTQRRSQRIEKDMLKDLSQSGVKVEHVIGQILKTRGNEPGQDGIQPRPLEELEVGEQWYNAECHSECW